MSSPRTILIVGATGKQGGAVLKALLSKPSTPPFSILALTRNPASPSALHLASQPNVSLLQGDLADSSSIFSKIPSPLYGAFLVTNPTLGPFAPKDTEEKQGKAFVDAVLECGVKHLVFSSVDRGGPERSDKDETPIPHFASKARIEKHLIQKISEQTGEKTRYTILRTVAFFENLTPNFFGKVFATTWRQQGSKPLYFISTRDIGIFAANAFREPEAYNDLTISIGAEKVDFEQGKKTFREVTGMEMPMTYGSMARFIKWMASDFGIMMDWLRDHGCVIDAGEMKRRNPEMMGFAEWLKGSDWAKKG